ncbi:DUF742 domain-containing protein [Euzebya tangerina]|uniref:DUF742 domain-containing protein n=1 Tax=Euzebya tangerina TaxID=591198 RepID=UPI000E30F10F|nr:DUF742 domain-containing protein [Euzebya tangerina]
MTAPEKPDARSPASKAAKSYSRLTRPYALTGGRTEPTDTSLAIEALVENTDSGLRARDSLTFEKRDIIDLTTETLSVAEVAAHLQVPLGVARVLVGDLVEDGYVVIHKPAAPTRTGGQDPKLLQKVLDGLRSL